MFKFNLKFQINRDPYHYYNKWFTFYGSHTRYQVRSYSNEFNRIYLENGSYYDFEEFINDIGDGSIILEKCSN